MPRPASWRSTRSQRSAARAVASSSGRSTVAASTAASIAATRKSCSIRCADRLGELLADVGAQLLERVELGGLGGEVVVELGQDLLPHLLDLDREDRVFAGELLGLVVVGEGDLDLALLAGASPRRAAPRSPRSAGRRRAPAGSRSALPPSKALPSIEPSKSISSASPSAAARSTGSSLAKPSRIRSISRSTMSSGTSGSARPTSRPLYSPSVASGRTPISNLKPSGSPSSSGAETISMLGSPTGLTPEPSSARSYHSGSESRIASSSTAPKPSRWITSDGGALPLRKAGHPHLPRQAAGGALMARSTSSAGTSTSTRTREPGSSVTWSPSTPDPR